MNAIKLIAAVAAAGTVAIVSSQAAALVCYSPAPGILDDLVQVSRNHGLEVACQSQSSSGAITRVVAHGGVDYFDNTLVKANLTEGPGYARTGGYNSNRVAMGCLAMDTNPTSNSAVSVACGGTVHFVAMEVGN